MSGTEEGKLEKQASGSSKVSYCIATTSHIPVHICGDVTIVVVCPQ